ncbi:MAG: glycosyltransferase family 2 protein [Ilumatobacteraceae bacterium]
MTTPAEERPTDTAPPVVAVMVVHEPGEWFAEVLAGLAAQDYPDLRLVAFLTGTTDPEVGRRVSDVLPEALVRHVEGNPGFGPVANHVMRVVEGSDGFFLFLHDDVALRSDGVSRLVEEAFRSNAAVSGPKLVEWDAPEVLQHVGLDADRAGYLVDVVDPGERDQEQHDAVRDMFALPSACMLVRNDVFRDIGGFAPNVPFLGEELDLCWRVHLLGARVVVNPAAVARHRGGFSLRANVIGGEARAERHRVWTVVTCTSLPRLPLVALRLVVQALADTALGLFNGQYRRGLAALRALVVVALDVPAVIARRKEVRALRRVPSVEVTSLQLKSSARLASFARHRRALRELTTSEIPAVARPAAPTSRGVSLVGIAALFVVLFGSRNFIFEGVANVGQFVPLASDDVGVFDSIRAYAAGWAPGWFGAPGAAPTFIGVLAVFGAVWLGSWGGLLTVLVVGSLIVGPIGAWRLGGAVGGARVRMFAALVYAAFPVGVLAVRDGRRDALIVWALAPWVLDFARRLAGLGRDEVGTPRETSVRPTGGRRSQLLASLLLVVAVAATFAPVMLVLVALIAGVLALSMPFTATPARANGWLLASLVGSLIGVTVLHLPWSIRFVDADWWESLVGPPAPLTARTLADVMTLGVDNVAWRGVLFAAYVPVALMLLSVRGARSGWSTRAMLLVAVPLALSLAREHGLVDVALPEPLILATVMSLGVCISSAVAFSTFVEGRLGAFTWRQLLSSISMVAVAVAVVPSLVVAANGRWSQPDATLSQLVTQLPDDADGDYYVMYIGDSRMLPVAGSRSTLAGAAYGVLRDGGATGVDLLAPTSSAMSDALARAVDVLLTGESLRAGRLLSPLAVRYVVVPLRDSTWHSRSNPRSGPVGDVVVAHLADQLDFRRVYSATDLVIFENMAALPATSILNEKSAVASRQALEANLLAEPLVSRATFATGFGADRPLEGSSLSGTLHLAVPFSDRWTLSVDGARVAPRVAFGATTAFDAPVTGSGEIRLRSSTTHLALLVVQLALWLAVLAVTFNPSRFRGRVRAAREVVEVSLRGDDDRRMVL